VLGVPTRMIAIMCMVKPDDGVYEATHETVVNRIANVPRHGILAHNFKNSKSLVIQSRPIYKSLSQYIHNYTYIYTYRERESERER